MCVNQYIYSWLTACWCVNQFVVFGNPLTGVYIWTKYTGLLQTHLNYLSNKYSSYKYFTMSRTKMPSIEHLYSPIINRILSISSSSLSSLADYYELIEVISSSILKPDGPKKEKSYSIYISDNYKRDSKHNLAPTSHVVCRRSPPRPTIFSINNPPLLLIILSQNTTK